MDPLLDVYSEPCVDCHEGQHQHCTGRSLDHPHDSTAPCPCRAAGHPTP